MNKTILHTKKLQQIKTDNYIKVKKENKQIKKEHNKSLLQNQETLKGQGSRYLAYQVCGCYQVYFCTRVSLRRVSTTYVYVYVHEKTFL